MKDFDRMNEEGRKEIIAKVAKSFSEHLKELRQEKQLSQKAVAEKLGVPVSTYANWEQGRREPNIYDIVNLLLAFGVEANELFVLD